MDFQLFSDQILKDTDLYENHHVLFNTIITTYNTVQDINVDLLSDEFFIYAFQNFDQLCDSLCDNNLYLESFCKSLMDAKHQSNTKKLL